jgi:murein DD-endopeptidase MepM/ murein hydrolase activator NlpD
MRVRGLWIPLLILVVAAAACFPSGGAVIPDIRCPVDGSTYRDDFGEPRPGGRIHGGIDMHAPDGTPVWAVKSGNVQFALESLGGLVAYLYADDGNVYYYAHMSDNVGSNQRVAQSDQIGFVGETGNATSPHLHFEIRLKGVNGEKTDPYNTLRDAGC